MPFPGKLKAAEHIHTAWDGSQVKIATRAQPKFSTMGLRKTTATTAASSHRINRDGKPCAAPKHGSLTFGALGPSLPWAISSLDRACTLHAPY